MCCVSRQNGTTNYDQDSECQPILFAHKNKRPKTNMNTVNVPIANAIPIVPLTIEDHTQSKQQQYYLPHNTNNKELNDEQTRRLMEQGFTRGEFQISPPMALKDHN